MDGGRGGDAGAGGNVGNRLVSVKHSGRRGLDHGVPRPHDRGQRGGDRPADDRRLRGGTGWTAAYACEQGFGGTSSLNNTANPVASNLTVVRTNAAGDFCVRSQHPTDLVVDVIGTLHGTDAHSPVRLFDSRTNQPPQVCHDAPNDVGTVVLVCDPNPSNCRFVTDPSGTDVFVCDAPVRATPTHRATDFKLSIGNPHSTAFLQVTTDNYGNGGTGWTAVYDCSLGFRGTSTLNNKANPIASNTVIANFDDSGSICIKSQYPTDVVVDVLGEVTSAQIATPQRVFDSRSPAPSPVAARKVHVGPARANVVLQVTTDNYRSGTGWTSVYACADGFTGSSSLNNAYYPVAANLVIVTTDADGDVCTTSLQPTDLIVDLLGTLPTATIHSPRRILDTRLTP